MVNREPALTFDGALKVLGQGESKTVERLSKALGGAVLAAGAVAGFSTLGPAALAPLVVVEPLWGWIDQKNEAISLLKHLIKKFDARVGNAETRSRRQLLAAAHTAIVVDSYFQALQEVLGGDAFKALEITDEEKLALVSTTPGNLRETNSKLYFTEVPCPSPALGFEENTSRVANWFDAFNERVEDFLSGLSSWNSATLPDEVLDGALGNYRASYEKLSQAAAEFRFWSSMWEHSATRQTVRESSTEIVEILEEQRFDLRRIEHLLELTTRAGSRSGDPQEAVNLSNLSRLTEPIIQNEEQSTTGALILPLVEEAFVSPKFRVCQYDARNSRPSDEHWWAKVPKLQNLDLWLTSFATSIDAARTPLVLLGHPGAGKTMLMKVLAARLPSNKFTTILVSLRKVSSNAPVVEQVQQALDQTTNRRVRWPDLADASEEAMRVVIMDGLDELLQASSADRNGYLHELIEFQRIESEQGRPVVVLVTSRTVVADRVEIPDGAPIVKLEAFEKDEIEQWLDVWNSKNMTAVSSGFVAPLDAAVAIAHEELSSQPLLLLMLAVYSADPASEPLDAGTSSTTLYHRLITSFARREVVKAPTHLSEHQIELGISQQIERLAIAALSMFNRGGQSVSEYELSRDLAVLLAGYEGAEPGEPGRRLLAEFFFMHAPEATKFGQSEDSDASASRSRAYEFLHATFGEFLVAYRLTEELRDVAERAYSGRRKHDPEDDLLHALIRNQPLIARSSIVNFISDLFRMLDSGERKRIDEALTFLLARYRQRAPSGSYDGYQPDGLDYVRQCGCYSVNLATLLLSLHSPGSVDMLQPFNRAGTPTDEWEGVVTLWRASLTLDEWRALGNGLFYDGNSAFLLDDLEPVSDPDFIHARLTGSSERQSRLTWGRALYDNDIPDVEAFPFDAALAQVVSTTAGFSPIDFDWLDLLSLQAQGMTDEQRAYALGALNRLLLTRQARTSLAAKLIKWIINFGSGTNELDPVAVFVNFCRFPAILYAVPDIADPVLYEGSPELIVLGTCIPAFEGRTAKDDEAEDDYPADAGLAEFESIMAHLRSVHPEYSEISERLDDLTRMTVDRILHGLRDDRWDGSKKNRHDRSRFPIPARGIRGLSEAEPSLQDED